MIQFESSVENNVIPAVTVLTFICSQFAFMMRLCLLYEAAVFVINVWLTSAPPPLPADGLSTIHCGAGQMYNVTAFCCVLTYGAVDKEL